MLMEEQTHYDYVVAMDSSLGYRAFEGWDRGMPSRQNARYAERLTQSMDVGHLVMLGTFAPQMAEAINTESEVVIGGGDIVTDLHILKTQHVIPEGGRRLMFVMSDYRELATTFALSNVFGENYDLSVRLVDTNRTAFGIRGNEGTLNVMDLNRVRGMQILLKGVRPEDDQIRQQRLDSFSYKVVKRIVQKVKV